MTGILRAPRMVFASITFLALFLPLNLAAYFLAPGLTWKNSVLLVFSLVFYAWGEPLLVFLLLLTAAINFLHGLLVERFRGSWRAKAALGSALVFDLGALALFKYSAFAATSLNSAFSLALPVPEIPLPLGISFYTFQSISYMVDVYRGQTAAQRSFLRYLTYVFLFHHLLAGPIVRYADIAHEIVGRRLTLAGFSDGVTRFCRGLFKKVCFANVAGELVARYLDPGIADLSVAEAWFGLTLFTLQIYYDFSGYSDMAIGLGRMVGFHYRENFDHPYIARSVTDFWRRWHISLGTFFRDYVYIPLGGRKRHPYRNLAIVWFLTGLWHGAHWNFILWGAYFGVLIAAERIFLKRLLEALPRVVGHVYLLAVVIVGWALFYFVDVVRLRDFLTVLFGFSGASAVGTGLVTTLRENALWLVLAVLGCVPLRGVAQGWYDRLGQRVQSLRPALQLALAGGNAVLLVLATCLLLGRTYNPFLYYRF